MFSGKLLSNLKILVFYSLLIIGVKANAQCGPIISTFPYSQGFEASAAWTTGGANNDWAWGTPAHPTINTAGGGVKSWMVGGLTGSSYNDSELAWLMSPCFDFTTLNYPWISFKIFWEDEYHYDGMVLQYSFNGGTSWSNVGAFNDPVNCLNDHWYNYASVNYLTSASPKHGWTGRIGNTSGSCQGTNGSGGWVTAKHCMSNLAGQPSVRFRFLFGSGTTCNAFDGIAIDDVFIDNAPANSANFTFACAGGNTVNFTNTSGMCPSGYLWNFGDGSATSTTQNPSHTYSAAGTYNVTLTSSGPCNAANSVTLPVSILGVTTAVTSAGCPGSSNGTATATVTGNASTVTYNWMPGSLSTASIASLAPGTYTVSVSAAASCSATATALVTSSAALTVTTTSLPVSCFGGNNGSVTATPNGGTSPYTYAWTGGGNAATYSNLIAGTYTVTVNDNTGCTGTAASTVTQPLVALSVNATYTAVDCFGGNNGTASAIGAGGTAPYTYAWLPSGGTAANAVGLTANTYSVTITDFNLCTASTSTTVTQPASALNGVVTPTPSNCGLNNGAASVVASGGTSPYTYLWMPGSITTANASPLAAGNYTLTLTDAHTCTYYATTMVASIGNIVASITSTPISCYGFTNGTATASVSGGFSPYNYLWSNGTNGSVNNNLGAGNYCVTATDNNGCTDTACVHLANPAPFNASFTSNVTETSLENADVFFTDLTNGSATWLWYFGDNSLSTLTNPDHIYTSVGTYPVTLITANANGCKDTVVHEIIIDGSFTFYAPNAFTPNDDDHNNKFIPKGSGWDKSTFNMWIFDRWGNIVYDTTNPEKGWNGRTANDGELSPMDVYVWKVTLTDDTGNNHKFLGRVTLIR